MHAGSGAGGGECQGRHGTNSSGRRRAVRALQPGGGFDPGGGRQVELPDALETARWPAR